MNDGALDVDSRPHGMWTATPCTSSTNRAARAAQLSEPTVFVTCGRSAHHVTQIIIDMQIFPRQSIIVWTSTGSLSRVLGIIIHVAAEVSELCAKRRGARGCGLQLPHRTKKSTSITYESTSTAVGDALLCFCESFWDDIIWDDFGRVDRRRITPFECHAIIIQDKVFGYGTN